MSLLVPSLDVSDTSQDENQTENAKSNDKLNNNCDNDIQKILIETEKNLQKIMKINSQTFDKLVNQLQLSLLKQLKQALKKLNIDNNNNNNNNKSQDEEKQMEMIEYHEDKSKTYAYNLQVDVLNGSILGDADHLTVVSPATGFSGITGVSSIAAPLSMNDPLIVIMGIGEYDGMPDLDGVSKDYDNIIDAFVKYWKYKIFYQSNNNNNNNNNKYIYTNDINDIDNNYKIKWNGDDIDDFIEESRKYVVKNKHDGLIFAISSHGDSGRVFYDSECEKYDLDSIFVMYSSQGSALLESYSETEQESNHLLSIPKIFFLDMCRGNQKAKVTQIATEKHETKTMDDVSGKQETKAVMTVVDSMIDETKEESKSSNENQKDHKHWGSVAGAALSLHNKKKEKKEEETFVFKGINKEDAHTLVGQMANFAKVYANADGYSVMGGSQQGGIFMRSVCRVFKDVKYVRNHQFTNIIFKIREYTKRDATLKSNLFNFTQIVEHEGTLERQVIFGSKYINSLFSHSLFIDDGLSTLDEKNDGDDEDHMHPESQKLYITNLSLTNKIGVLVEMEQNREKRMKLFETLEKSRREDNYNSFIENGFVIIDEKYGLHEFVKVWDEYYVTVFVLSDVGTNKLIHDRKLYFDDHLYFKGDKLYGLHEKDILPKCNKVSNECHSLNPMVSVNSNVECRLCATTIDNNSGGDLSFECKSCQEFLCKDCCHSLIVNKTPQFMKESQCLDLTIVNTSPRNKIAVLVNIYDCYNEKRYNMIDSEKYKDIKEEKAFIDNGFLIINSNGNQHTFKSVWKSACITIIEIRNAMNDLVFDEQTVFDEYPLYYNTTNKLIRMQDFALEIVGLEQKTKRSMEITLKKPFHEHTVDLEYKIQTEITNGTQILKNEHPIEILQQFEEEGKVCCREIEFNVDELEREFKESQLNYNVKLVVVDPKNEIQGSFNAIKSIPIFTRIGFDYSCTLTTLNGKGRYGPTNMDEYKGQCHYNDTKFDVKTTRKGNTKGSTRLISFFQQNNKITKGMQFWTIPKSGKYKVICYGAKGGDSIHKDEKNHLSGGKGAKIGSIFKLFENDIIKIVCGQKGKNNNYYGGGGGGGTYFILHKIGNKNPNYNENEIVNIPLIIAAGGNGACNASFYNVNGIDGLCDTSENRNNNYGGYETNGEAGRGASFKNDFNIFQSHKESDDDDYNVCNPNSFLGGAIGGQGFGGYHGCDGGFGGGGGSYVEGGGGGGYIGGLVSKRDFDNFDSNKYSSYGALSYICQDKNIVENVNVTQSNNMIVSISGQNNDNGKIEIMFMA